MAAAKPEPRWVQLGALEQLEDSGRFVTKIAGQQIAVFKTKKGLFAINNRCPHQGYPLVEGTLQDNCTLACNWHGWTFNLESGETIQGRDAVRTYPTELRDSDIWADLAPEPPEVLQERAYEELEEAMLEHDYERIARALCRLEGAGASYEEAAVWAINWSADKLEGGFGHAYAGMADWFTAMGSDPELRLVAFLEALAHLSWDTLFSAPPILAKQARKWNEHAFLDAIERMDQEEALELCLGAFKEGLGFQALKPLFLKMIFSHYAGFGHPTIYVQKAESLIESLGQAVEEALCQQLMRYLCVAAREDLIPEFRIFGDMLKVDQKQAQTYMPSAADLAQIPTQKLLPLVDGATMSNLDKWEMLVAAAASSMLLFDTRLQHNVEQPIAQNVGWLDFTHTLTFAEAFLFHAEQDENLWRSGILQMACFVGRNARYLRRESSDKWLVTDKTRFIAEQKARLFDMGGGEYIYNVHRLKLLIAIENMIPKVGADTAGLLLAALNRFLSSEVRERHPARAAYQAKRTVEREGYYF